MRICSQTSRGQSYLQSLVFFRHRLLTAHLRRLTGERESEGNLRRLVGEREFEGDLRRLTGERESDAVL